MRKLFLATALTVSCLGAAEAQAGWNEFWGSVCLDWHRNNTWPEPFVTQDRELVRAPFRIMVNKGWQLENTLAEYHFDPKTGALNNAGKARLKWIVTQPSHERRTVFVLQGATQEDTANRIDTVQQEVASVLREGEMPAVLATDLAPRTWNSENIDSINRAWRTGQPAPTLPASTGGGGATP